MTSSRFSFVHLKSPVERGFGAVFSKMGGGRLREVATRKKLTVLNRIIPFRKVDVFSGIKMLRNRLMKRGENYSRAHRIKSVEW